MDAPTIRDRVNTELNELTLEELQGLLDYIEAMKSSRLPDDYDPDRDPAIGFLSGPTDLASKAKQILKDEVTSQSGWTQKKD